MKIDLIERAAFLSRLRRLFRFISWLAIVPLIASAGLAAVMLSGIDFAIADMSTLINVLRLQFLARSAAFALFILAALVWLCWVYLSTRLLRVAGVERLHHGPLSAIALHFVPIVSYVMPMLIMSELERATRDPSQWRYLDNNPLAATSWLIGKLSMIALMQSVAFQLNAETIQQHSPGLWLLIAATLLAVIGVNLFNRYLKHMEVLQTALAARMGEPDLEATA